MIELFALLSAVFYGAADFFGGLTARRASTVATVLVSQLAGLVLLLAVMPFLPKAYVLWSDWSWGIVAGFSGGIGVALLYRALALGTMAVVAPITAVFAAMIPVLVAIAWGERLRTTAAFGIALAFVAIFLVSRSPGQEGAPSPSATDGSFRTSLILALLAGAIIGLFFLSLAKTSTEAGMWPLIAARITSVALFGGLAAATRQRLKMNGTAMKTAVAGGSLDMLANVLYMVAARVGPLSIVVTLASLYPAGTVLLARMVLRERLGFGQIAGIVCALGAVLLIVATPN